MGDISSGKRMLPPVRCTCCKKNLKILRSTPPAESSERPIALVIPENANQEKEIIGRICGDYSNRPLCQISIPERTFEMRNSEEEVFFSLENNSNQFGPDLFCVCKYWLFPKVQASSVFSDSPLWRFLIRVGDASHFTPLDIHFIHWLGEFLGCLPNAPVIIVMGVNAKLVARALAHGVSSFSSSLCSSSAEFPEFPEFEYWCLDEVELKICRRVLPSEKCWNQMISKSNSNSVRRLTFEDLLLNQKLLEELFTYSEKWFKPLGGHGRQWIFHPDDRGSRTLLKKTTLSEGGFYASILNFEILMRNEEAFDGIDWSLKEHCLTNKSSFENSDNKEEAAVCSQSSSSEIWEQRMIGREFKKFLVKVKTITRISQLSCLIGMENLLFSDLERLWHSPAFCAMDLKIGTLVYGIGADEEKQERMKLKSMASTSASTGLCVIAYRVVDPETHQVIRSVSRNETKGWKHESQVAAALNEFLSQASVQTLERLKEEIDEIQNWVERQTFVSLRASSLLIVYDAADLEVEQKDKRLVHMIDFAQASLFHNEVDKAYLTGILNLSSHLKKLLFLKRSPQYHHITTTPNLWRPDPS